MRHRQQRIAWVIATIASLLTTPALASPIDLQDATPRWVAVAFEVSPREEPARLRNRFTPPLPARLEPTPEPDRVRVRIAGAIIERFLLPDHDPEPGSFGDFVWTFDTRTGHVTAASLAGAVRKQVSLGFASWTTNARIQVHMNTHGPVAFETRQILGEPVHGLCEHPAARGCTRVEPRALDPASGYVNAVGALQVDSGQLRLENFSPLGEAIFSEVRASEDFWSHGLDAWGPAEVAAPPPSR